MSKLVEPQQFKSIDEAFTEIRVRKKILGSYKTAPEIAKTILARLRGDNAIPPMNITEVAEHLAVERTFVRKYINGLIACGEIPLDQHGKPQYTKKKHILNQKFTEFDNDKFFEDELIKKWMISLQVRINGKPKSNWQGFVRGFKLVCNHLQVKPVSFVESIQQFTDFTNILTTDYTNHKFKLQSGRLNSGSADGVYNFIMPCRDFAQYNGVKPLALPRGMGGSASGKVRRHGQYADVKLTPEQITQANNYIIKKYGMDSDVFVLFWFGIESCARKEALLSVELKWEVGIENGAKYFLCKVFETKTQHTTHGGWFEKYIFNPDLQKILTARKKRGFSTLFENTYKQMNSDKFADKIYDVWSNIGIASETNPYFYGHKFHIFRHLGAHRLLRLTGHNYDKVAMLGGWLGTGELKKSYGALSKEIVLEEITKTLSRGFIS